ncbi:hypothetical protein F751_2470 [Auxenochlorella protothecoides]|uniref:Uncharacterized protein n=1 Tax=Auxenochlorella protothecoides TaxID=3075 RepID=A0A087SIS4_AUXPR|nr:hypothetical protein F751_2470 [Auxenochlorella protothecoides]KFM25628.1 hypothetical protein F751_2470 [Auxenochlorella protothecoides]
MARLAATHLAQRGRRSSLRVWISPTLTSGSRHAFWRTSWRRGRVLGRGRRPPLPPWSRAA